MNEQTPNSLSNKSEDNLDWLAFCYIADELDQQQRDAFEIRLAEDQSARQAVVDAMEQSQLLVAALEKSVPVDYVAAKSNERDFVSDSYAGYSVASRRTRLVRLLTVAAAMLLLAVGMTWYSTNSERISFHDPIPNVQVASLETEQLATAWVDAMEMDEMSQQEFEDEILEFDPVDSSIDDEASWMFAALSDISLNSETEIESENDDTILPGEIQ